jgi:hypothetical protein
MVYYINLVPPTLHEISDQISALQHELIAPAKMDEMDEPSTVEATKDD